MRLFLFENVETKAPRAKGERFYQLLPVLCDAMLCHAAMLDALNGFGQSAAESPLANGQETRR